MPGAKKIGHKILSSEEKASARAEAAKTLSEKREKAEKRAAERKGKAAKRAADGGGKAPEDSAKTLSKKIEKAEKRAAERKGKAAKRAADGGGKAPKNTDHMDTDDTDDQERRDRDNFEALQKKMESMEWWRTSMEEHAAEVPSMKDMAQDMARIRAQNPDRMARIDGMMSNLIIPSQLINDHVFSAHIGKLMSDPAAAKDVTEGAFMMVEQSRGAAGDGGHGNGETGNAGDEHTS